MEEVIFTSIFGIETLLQELYEVASSVIGTFQLQNYSLDCTLIKAEHNKKQKQNDQAVPHLDVAKD